LINVFFQNFQTVQFSRLFTANCRHRHVSHLSHVSCRHGRIYRNLNFKPVILNIFATLFNCLLMTHNSFYIRNFCTFYPKQSLANMQIINAIYKKTSRIHQIKNFSNVPSKTIFNWQNRKITVPKFHRFVRLFKTRKSNHISIWKNPFCRNICKSPFNSTICNTTSRNQNTLIFFWNIHNAVNHFQIVSFIIWIFYIFQFFITNFFFPSFVKNWQPKFLFMTSHKFCRIHSSLKKSRNFHINFINSFSSFFQISHKTSN